VVLTKYWGFTDWCSSYSYIVNIKTVIVIYKQLVSFNKGLEASGELKE